MQTESKYPKVKVRTTMTNQALADAMGVGVCSIYAWKRGAQKVSRYHREIIELIEQGIDITRLKFTPEQWSVVRSTKTIKDIVSCTGLAAATVSLLDDCLVEIPRKYQIILAHTLGM